MIEKKLRGLKFRFREARSYGSVDRIWVVLPFFKVPNIVRHPFRKLPIYILIKRFEALDKDLRVSPPCRLTLLATGTAGAHDRGGIGFENVSAKRLGFTVMGFVILDLSEGWGRSWGGVWYKKRAEAWLEP